MAWDTCDTKVLAGCAKCPSSRQNSLLCSSSACLTNCPWFRILRSGAGARKTHKRNYIANIRRLQVLCIWLEGIKWLLNQKVEQQVFSWLHSQTIDPIMQFCSYLEASSRLQYKFTTSSYVGQRCSSASDNCIGIKTNVALLASTLSRMVVPGTEVRNCASTLLALPFMSTGSAYKWVTSQV